VKAFLILEKSAKLYLTIIMCLTTDLLNFRIGKWSHKQFVNV